MKSTLCNFFSHKLTIIGITIAVLFQLIFTLVPGLVYKDIDDNVSNLSVGIINLDKNGEISKSIFNSIKKSDKFNVKTFSSKNKLLSQLNKRKVYLAIEIPKGFTSNIINLKTKANIIYRINQSNSSTVKNAMQGFSTALTAILNKNVSAQVTDKAVNGIIKAQQTAFSKILAQAAPSPQTGAVPAFSQKNANINAKKMQLQKKSPSMIKKTNNKAPNIEIGKKVSERVTQKLIYSNKIDDSRSGMLPMMLYIGSFIGAMMLADHLNKTSLELKSNGKWLKLFSRIIVSAITSITVSLIGILMIKLLGEQMDAGFIELWLFHSLTFFAYTSLAQISLIFFGGAGALVNPLLLCLQLNLSGAIIPRDWLSDFCFNFGNIFPAIYDVRGNYDLLFGGPSSDINEVILSLSIMIIILLALSAVGTFISHDTSEYTEID